jgi:site-specific DNA-methyltransferase (adenine-specific)
MAEIYLENNDALSVLHKLDTDSIDLIYCDLPFGTTQCSWDEVIPFDKLWEQYERIIKPNGVIVLTAKQPFTSKLVCSKIDWLHESLVWIKHKPTNFANGKYMHLNYTEDILVFGKGKPTYNPQMQPRKSERVKQAQTGSSKNWRSKPKIENEVAFSTDYEPREWTVYNADMKLPMNYIELPSVVSNSKEKQDHPTQKTVALFEYLIKTYSNENDLILDNCAGSGTTAIACLNTNRQFIVMEQEQKYYDIILKRGEDFNKKFEPQTLFGNEM